MKQFFRTIGGKVLLFLLLNATVLGLIASTLGAIYMTGANIYTHTEEQNIEQNLKEEIINNCTAALYRLQPADTMDNITVLPYYDPQDYDGMVYQLYDVSGSEIALNSYQVPTGEVRSFVLAFTTFIEIWGSEDPEIGEVSKLTGYELLSISESDVIPTLPSGTVYYMVVYQDMEAFRVSNAIFLFATHVAYTLRFTVYIIGAACLLLSILFFVMLMCVSGRQKGDENLHPGPLNKVPFDLLLFGVIFMAFLAYLLMDDLGGGFVAGCFLVFLSFQLLLGLAMSIASRLKEGTLFTNTVIWRLLKLLGHFFRWLGRLLKSIPLVWGVVLSLALIYLVGLFILNVAQFSIFWQVTLFTIGFVLLSIVILVYAINFQWLKKGGEELAKGNLGYVINENGMAPYCKEHARSLNSLGVGLNAAVEERLKSERMKTELITNVSHDIKTPLTSIINYASLLENEIAQNEAPDKAKVKEYSEVLTRQSDRLKRLIEDLVEASKASSGNLEVHPVPCDANVFITQAAGEYEEKLSAAHLTLVARQSKEPIMILADGRRMWRIFDNLMNNICKYSQEGTRVYLNLERFQNEAVIIFKNTSRDPLDIPAEELMERFVRGDKSRHSEGNGLGLSIARSLTELQGGQMKLLVDGDLFKVILRFPVIDPLPQNPQAAAYAPVNR